IPIWSSPIGSKGRTDVGQRWTDGTCTATGWLRTPSTEPPISASRSAPPTGWSSTVGGAASAGPARRELLATGEKVRKRSDETRDQLTPQEEQIARLARDGLSNPEIGAQLFISARTVEWHAR